jgi:2,4-dienoyl-CoA reductase-like NADH-dependent reductase (Old Yellow Enzyme family)
MTDAFSPANLGPVRLRNRIIKAATFEGRTPDTLVTDALIDFHRQPARGGVGMTTVAYLAVSPEGRTHRQQIWLRQDAVPGLRRLTDAIHAEGAAAAAQIGHAGPVANAASNRLPALGPGTFLSPPGFRRTKAATQTDLNRIVRAHADAARLATESGFDTLEVHCGHNYLLSAFLSPRLNKRDDHYGGNLTNRTRLTRDVLRAIRDAVGSRVAITAKLNMADGVRDGLQPDDSVQVARWLEHDGTVDALELTAGSVAVVLGQRDLRIERIHPAGGRPRVGLVPRTDEGVLLRRSRVVGIGGAPEGVGLVRQPHERARLDQGVGQRPPFSLGPVAPHHAVRGWSTRRRDVPRPAAARGWWVLGPGREWP